MRCAVHGPTSEDDRFSLKMEFPTPHTYSDLHLVQGARGSRQTRAQVCRGRRNNWGDPNQVNRIMSFPPPTTANWMGSQVHSSTHAGYKYMCRERP